jgi:TolA-binding protein
MPVPSRTVLLAVVAGIALTAPRASAQPTPDQQAAMILAAGQKAYNDANYPFAAERFREFLQKFGGHKDANAARYGLGLALLDIQPPDFPKAVEALSPPANEKNFKDHALARYYLGVAQRGLGHKELAEAVAKPNERPQRTQAANGRFTEAERSFTQAREAFEKKTPPDAEWAARARCDQAEMELRLNKNKEARATAEPFAKDAAFAKSKSRPLGLYYHGTACFLLHDIPAAGKSLGLLAPFDQPFGPHARYLMGRVHASQDEKAEAAAAFNAVVAGHDKQKKDAAEALKQPDKFKADPWEKARLEALVRGPAPDYVAGSVFYGACLNYEAGKFGEALPKFQAFVKDNPTSPLKDDAVLRVGFCLVQTKQNDEAVRTLQPLTNVQRLADQAFYWLGKAQVGLALAADPNNANARTQAFNAAIQSFRTAADRANQLAGSDPEAKGRRAETLLELADALLANKQARDAVSAYETVWNEKLLPARQEETLQRIVAAYHLAGDFQSSDNRIGEFKQKFPQSPLLPLVLFRGAENAYARAEKLAKEHHAGAKQGFADAAKRYEEVVAKFPEFERVNRARYELALCHVATEDWEKAAAVLDKIPAPERNGDLAGVSFVLADCLIRTAPAKAEDALQDNMLREKLGNAAGLLEAFVAANPKAPEAADALLKFGYCQKRLGIQLAPGNERNDAFNKARQAYERLGREYAQSPAAGTAALERAKVMALQGDKGGAVGQLNAFKTDPLAKSPVAPLAYVALATLLREQNQAPQAAQVMQEARQRFEGPLNGDPDPARKEWVHLLRYHHGVALAESGKCPEARREFDQVVQQANGKPIGAEAALRGGQCLVDEARKKVEAAEKEKARPNLRPEQVAQIDNQVKAAKGELLSAARQLEQRAEQFKRALPQSEARARMLYDAAWAIKAAGGDPTPAYTKLIADFGTLSLAVDARLELAELLVEKQKPDDAVKLLKDALDAEPTDKPTPADTSERIRLRLGSALFDKKDLPAAQAQFDAVAGNEKSPHRAAALYRSAECLMAQAKFEDAKNKLVIFRDNGAFQNVAGVSDRAMLRLGHALAGLKQWEPSRQACEAVVARFGDGNPWAADARYGMGWALQNAGRFDEAVNAYAQVTQKTTDERAGKAHLQIGLCRSAQKRWDDAGKAFATVYYGYDLPDLKFAAMVEHARALGEQKHPAEATKLLERVVKEAPKDGTWAKAATELLAKIKK